MSSGGRIDRMLDSIPGYRGYRDRERRRDSDRAIRNQLANDYSRLADRLGRVATRLADERKLDAVSVVSRPHGRLVSFIDRLRTASYGYAPLFANAVVDEGALDQLAAFDRSLADLERVLGEHIAAIESIDPESAEFMRAADDIAATAQQLHDRFDKRDDLIHSATALKERDLLALLEPANTIASPAAYRLNQGEALARAGVNYLIIGRVTVESRDGNWRAFQLRGGSDDEWLLVSDTSSEPVYWMRRAVLDGAPGEPNVSADGASYTLDRDVAGTGEVTGKQGSAEKQQVRFMRYRSESGDETLAIFAWHSGSLALAGTAIEPIELELFSRER